MCTHKSSSRDVNQVLNDGTPVTFSNIYSTKDDSRILRDHVLVLIDCGSLHIMANAPLFDTYKNDFFRKEKSTYKTAAGNFNS